MKVHFFNKTLQGGAAIGAMRQFESINGMGVDRTFFTREVPIEGGQYAPYDPWQNKGLLTKAVTRLQVRNFYRNIEAQTAPLRDRYEKFTPAALPYKTLYPAALPDIVHLQWVSDWIDLPSFFNSIPHHIPIFWTLHDMFPFTGGCHYNWGCNKLQLSCGNCPQLVDPSENDFSAQGIATKMRTYKGRKLYVLANSNWMADKARGSSSLRDASMIETLHLPIDTSIYRPIDKEACKQKIGINKDTTVIAFGAESVHNYRKGFDLLIEALQKIDKPTQDIVLVYFGNKSDAIETQCSLPVHHLGFLPSGIQQAKVYNAADLFVVPSRQEAFGQTALEAAACGVAVAAFNVGGLSDVVHHGYNGLLAEEVSPSALAALINELVNDRDLRVRLGANGAQLAKNNFSLSGQGNKLLKLYKQALQV